MVQIWQVNGHLSAKDFVDLSGKHCCVLNSYLSSDLYIVIVLIMLIAINSISGILNTKVKYVYGDLDFVRCEYIYIYIKC